MSFVVTWSRLLLLAAAIGTAQRAWAVADEDVSASDYASLQEAIDAHPGRMVRVPQGEYEIDQPLRITADGSGLYGYGLVVQTNPTAAMLVIEGAADVRVESLSFTRRATAPSNHADGIRCTDCRNVRLEGLRISDNKSQGAAIRLAGCADGVIQNCRIANYKGVGIDDRTQNELLGYAFHCIDGHGILISSSTGTIIRGNRIVEYDLLPTRALRDEHRLGTLTEGRNPTRLGELGRRAVRDNLVNNWHQGSAIAVTGPRDTRHTLITGNFLENAGQGVDMHCDLAICSDNVVHKAMIGLKATHGSRNLVLDGNLLTGVDLWGILINPGAGSHAAAPASGDRPAMPANVDGGIVVSNNVITDYGEGNEYWNWGGAHDDRGSSYAIALLEPQLKTNPPLRDVLLHGNMVYDSTRDEYRDSQSPPPRPRYRYAVYVEQGQPAPQGIRFHDNLLHPGTSGVANIDLDH